ncbi:hypothetical protein C0J45_2061 [Silurus meridionalis]|nr:hypothetical protein C0J45_2061 [Silurus meridionalis]
MFCHSGVLETEVHRKKKERARCETARRETRGHNKNGISWKNRNGFLNHCQGFPKSSQSNHMMSMFVSTCVVAECSGGPSVRSFSPCCMNSGGTRLGCCSSRRNGFILPVDLIAH